MNKKGMTIIELIVAVSLISIVLVFLVQLLTVLKEYDNPDENNAEMLVNNATMISTINNDLIKKGLSNITCSNGGYNVKLTFNDNSTKDLQVKNNNIIIYGDIGRSIANSSYVYGTPSIYFNSGALQIKVSVHKGNTSQPENKRYSIVASYFDSQFKTSQITGCQIF